eukprot:1642448-Amphidinium_carterae.1
MTEEESRGRSRQGMCMTQLRRRRVWCFRTFAEEQQGQRTSGPHCHKHESLSFVGRQDRTRSQR